MINKQHEIDKMINLASSGFEVAIFNSYGNIGIENLKIVLDSIRNIFKNLYLKNFNSIYIFKSDNFNLPSTFNVHNIQNYAHITNVSGPNLIIKINTNSDISVCPLEDDFDIKDILETDFVYIRRDPINNKRIERST